MSQELEGRPKQSSLRQQIDENLQKVYRDMLDEEMPDKFKDLIERLRKKGTE